MIEINGTLTDEERQKLLNWETVKRARRHANLVICGGSSSDNSSTKLFTFTIDGTSYQAEDGMTWAEWCSSSYNTAGFYVHSYSYSLIYLSETSSSYTYVGGMSNGSPFQFDTIISGWSYSLLTGLAAGGGSN